MRSPSSGCPLNKIPLGEIGGTLAFQKRAVCFGDWPGGQLAGPGEDCQMNAQSRLFTFFMVLCVFSQASWVQGQVFPRVRFLKTIGDKTNEIKAHLIVTEGSIQVRDSQFSRTLKEIPYSEIKAATYSFSKHRRWRAGVAAAVAVNVFAAPLFFMKGKKHWLTFETEEDRLALRLDKRNFKDILSAVDRRLKDAVAFDGYREGTSRMAVESQPLEVGQVPQLRLENKGESTQDIERILVADQSAQAEDLVRLRRSVMAYLEDLPNFICDYTEHKYALDRASGLSWELTDTNLGEVRYIDGRSDYRVVSENGSPTGKTIWEVSAMPNSFGTLGKFFSPSLNYKFTSEGNGEFSFQSDAGITLVREFTRDGGHKGAKSYPTRGTVWVQEPDHAVRGYMEYFEVPKKGWLARALTSEFRPGEHSWFHEFGSINIGEKPYWLVKQQEVSFRYSDLENPVAARVVQTYDNCRRFGSDVISIRYGAEVATVQPDTGQAPGDMGGELPTPPLETGLEVDADLDAAKSPQISRQQGVPPAAPQPPLSAVRTSPKRNAPFEGTPTEAGAGVGPKIDPSSATVTNRPALPGPGSHPFPQRYGYRSSRPKAAPEGSPSLPSYGYRLYEPDLLTARPPIKNQANDRSVSWWFLLMVGIVAFSGGFLGNFLRGKAK